MATVEEKLAGLQCPHCGRENTYVPREIEYTAKVGSDTVTVTVRAGICTNSASSFSIHWLRTRSRRL